MDMNRFTIGLSSGATKIGPGFKRRMAMRLWRSAEADQRLAKFEAPQRREPFLR